MCVAGGEADVVDKALNLWTFVVLTCDTLQYMCSPLWRCWSLLPPVLAVCACAAASVTKRVPAWRVDLKKTVKQG